MKITKKQLRRLIREEMSKQTLTERGTGNPAFESEERTLMSAVVSFHQKYMLAMGMDPSNPADIQRTRRVINDIIGTVLGE
tara:strand:- start:1400 stop:1642 length:243 start_codon:yes stop_codon:yes gene_type:complete